MKFKKVCLSETRDNDILDISIVFSIALSIIPVHRIGIIPPKPRTSAFLLIVPQCDEKTWLIQVCIINFLSSFACFAFNGHHRKIVQQCFGMTVDVLVFCLKLVEKGTHHGQNGQYPLHTAACCAILSGDHIYPNGIFYLIVALLLQKTQLDI